MHGNFPLRTLRAAILPLALLCLCCAAQAQNFQSLSPYGERLFDEQFRAYPPFNEEKAAAEASERFKVFKKGEPASFSLKGRQVSGRFQGVDASALLIDDQRIPLSEIPEDLLEKFDEARVLESQAAFVRNARESFKLERMRSLEKARAELLRKYPALDERRLAWLFSAVEEPLLRLALMNECAGFYDASLPLSKPQPDLLDACLERVLKAHPDLELDGGRANLRQAIAEAKAKAKEAAARRELRAAALHLRPRAACPEFEPDGGPFSPSHPVSIHCPTPGAVIRYSLDGSDPDEFSPLYSAPIKLKQAAQIRAIAMHPDMNDSFVAGTAHWTGLGLYASYFDRLNFTGSTGTRVDNELDFDWTSSSPDPAIPADFFSAIWAGSICAPESGEYTLHIVADDGVRLWLDGRLLIDSWSEMALLERQAKAKLEAGRPANIKIAYCEFSSMPRIRLDWSSAKMRRCPVPSAALTAKGGYADELLRWNERQGGAYVNRAAMPNPGAVDGLALFKEVAERKGKQQSQDLKP